MNQEIDIEELKKEIKKCLEPLNLEKVILFGSYAYGNPNKDSDIDLYVVTKDEFLPKSWRDKSKIYLKVANSLDDFLKRYPTDLIVHTKVMHQKFSELNSSFAKKILQNGIAL
jgi:predicted nucleotidyltransferase